MNLTYPALLFEFAAVAALLLAAALLPGRAARLLRAAESRLSVLPTSLLGQLIFIGLFAVLLRAAFLPWLGPPVPLIHDEQSLLLQAQTFLEGRWANPTHPLWPHFQTFHVNQLPAYASVYFPGRGLPLVPGLLLAEEPWLGVWLSFVLFAMSTVWMLRGWTAPKVALAGGILVVLRLGAGSFWINSYWGGAFTALGAMLVVGAMPRLLRRPRWSHGLLLGLGALILMTTRPLEGALFCLAFGVFFLPRLLKAGPSIGQIALRAGLPLAACVALGTAALVQYNEATTGDPLVTPYEVNREQYAVAPAFLVAPTVERAAPAAPAPAHFERFYRDEAQLYDSARGSLPGLLAGIFLKLYKAWAFYIGPALTIPFMIGLWVSLRDPPIAGSLVAFFAANLLTTWNFPHYLAPIFPIILVIAMRGLVTLGHWSMADKPTGYVLSRGAFLAAAAPLLLLTTNLVTGRPAIASNSWDLPCCALRQSSPRDEVVERLTALPGRDLVLVQTNAFSPIHGEPVFNEPDIDGAPIVFAHSFGGDADRRLLEYFGDRRLWQFSWTAEGYLLEPLSR